MCVCVFYLYKYTHIHFYIPTFVDVYIRYSSLSLLHNGSIFDVLLYKVNTESWETYQASLETFVFLLWGCRLGCLHKGQLTFVCMSPPCALTGLVCEQAMDRLEL